MRLMFVIPKMTGGGAERVVANLCNYWCKDNDVRIVAIASKKSFYELDKRVELCGQNLEIKRKNIFTTLGCYAKYFSKSVKFIKKNVKEFKPDCVISFLVEADILTYYATKNNRDIVKVFSERADPTRRNKIRQFLAKKAYSVCDLFVCQSKKIYDYYSFIPDEMKVIIPNPIDVSKLPPAVVKEKNHGIVSVGRLSEQKNHKLLIESFISSIDELPRDCNLFIYGDGPLKMELQDMINNRGMDKRIKLAGVSENVLSEIKDYALFVLSSNFEGFPNVLLEAMAVGLPVISTDFYTGVARELIKKQNGIVVPVDDGRGLSGAIINVMQDEKRRLKMRKENVLVCQKYNVSKIGDLWIECMGKNVGVKNEKRRD